MCGSDPRIEPSETAYMYIYSILLIKCSWNSADVTKDDSSNDTRKIRPL